MSLTIEATFEKGVFVPVHPPTLPEHGRVRLHVEPISADDESPARIDHRRADRIRLDPELAAQIAIDDEFLPDNG